MNIFKFILELVQNISSLHLVYLVRRNSSKTGIIKYNTCLTYICSEHYHCYIMVKKIAYGLLNMSVLFVQSCTVNVKHDLRKCTL
jgi:hypothetical protein